MIWQPKNIMLYPTDFLSILAGLWLAERFQEFVLKKNIHHEFIGPLGDLHEIFDELFSSWFQWLVTVVSLSVLWNAIWWMSLDLADDKQEWS